MIVAIPAMRITIGRYSSKFGSLGPRSIFVLDINIVPLTPYSLMPRVEKMASYLGRPWTRIPVSKSYVPIMPTA